MKPLSDEPTGPEYMSWQGSAQRAELIELLLNPKAPLTKRRVGAELMAVEVLAVLDRYKPRRHRVEVPEAGTARTMAQAARRQAVNDDRGNLETVLWAAEILGASSDEHIARRATTLTDFARREYRLVGLLPRGHADRRAYVLQVVR